MKEFLKIVNYFIGFILISSCADYNLKYASGLQNKESINQIPDNNPEQTI